MNRMIATTAVMMLLLGVPQSISTSSGASVYGARKDKRAILFHGGPLATAVLLEDRSKANFAQVILDLWLADLPLTAGAGRPSIGLALFTDAEWDRYAAAGVSRADFRPAMAATRYWFFPMLSDAPPLGHLVGTTELRRLRPEADLYLVDSIIPVPRSDLVRAGCEAPLGGGDEVGRAEP